MSLGSERDCKRPERSASSRALKCRAMNTPHPEATGGTQQYSDFELRRLPDAALEVTAQSDNHPQAQRAYDVLKRRAENRAESRD